MAAVRIELGGKGAAAGLTEEVGGLDLPRGCCHLARLGVGGAAGGKGAWIGPGGEGYWGGGGEEKR